MIVLRSSLVVLVVAVNLAIGSTSEASGPSQSRANAVLAITDTGINPYHVSFRDRSPRANQHPSTYIEGFPRSARALKLTLDASNYWDAVRADCDVWRKVYPNRLYWIPGTKIIGAIRLNPLGNVDCSDPNPQDLPILDYDFHGTMVASRAVGNEFGACQQCRLVVVQGYHESQDWVAEQTDWIDAQSNSWGTWPYWNPTGTEGYNTPELVRDIERAARRHLAFWATGNGAVTHGTGGVGHPSLLDPRLTPSVVMVGGHDSGQVILWHGLPPHVVSDACSSPAAHHESLDEVSDDLGGGTSGATPYAAGVALRELLRARELLGDPSTGVQRGFVAVGDPPGITRGPLADGRWTLEEWKGLIFKTASPRPAGDPDDGESCGVLDEYNTLPVSWRDVPEGFPEQLIIGYGAVDSQAYRLAARVLIGDADMPDRTVTDMYFGADGALRETQHDIYSRP